MRLAILGLCHESNTFSRVPADYQQFEASGIDRGDGIVRRYRDSTTHLAGFLEAADALGFEAVPLTYAQTGPMGPITADAYDRLTAEMFGQLRGQGPWDGVLIANHGAAVTERHEDMDGAFSRAVRDIVGPDVPVGICLDMHANLSAEVVAATDVCLVWRTNPHLDPRVRGRKTAELVFHAARGDIRPRQALVAPPLVVNIVRQFTAEEPMRGIVEDCLAANERPGILDTSVAEGYPYADVPHMGMGWVAIADGDQAAAEAAARWMAGRAWRRRAALNAPVPSVQEALELAVAHYRGPRRRGDADDVATDGSPMGAPSSANEDGRAPRSGPIVLMDVGDNIGGGAPADSTHILEEAIRMGVDGLLQTLYDPEAVGACIGAGVGAEVSLEVGGKTDDRHGRPVLVRGTVRAITDGRWEDPGPTHSGYRFYDAGPSVRLDTAHGHTLLLTSRREGNTSRQQMYSIGIEPETYRIVVAKGVVSPRPAYQPIAGEVILVNSPGVTSADLSTFTYHRRRVPLYPFEPGVSWES